MSRPQGSRNRLVTLDYDVIAELAGGITGDTARRYAQRRLYDPRDLGSLLSWVNSRRQRQGEPLLGLPTDDASPAHSDDTATPVEAAEDIRVRVMPSGLVYDPTTGTYRDDDHGG